MNDPKSFKNVEFFLPTEGMDGFEEVALADGVASLDEFIARAAQWYIKYRKDSPTFPEELENARLRIDMDMLQDEHPWHDSAPKDIVD